MPNHKLPLRTALARGEIAARAGCNIETVRYYEQVDLLPPPVRTEGGHRPYGEELLKRLLFVRRTRSLGFTLDETRGLLRLVDGGNYTCAQVEALARAHIREIQRKIPDLRRLKTILRTMAARCSGGEVPECPIIEALFDPGARLSAGNPALGSFPETRGQRKSCRGDFPPRPVTLR